MERVLGVPSEHLKIATLMPIYPIEAGFGIHRELASPPFFFRTNDDLARDELERLVGIGPSTVEAWLHANNVRAVLTGYDTRLELGFRAYATTRNMACFRLDLRVRTEPTAATCISTVLSRDCRMSADSPRAGGAPASS